MQVNNENKVGYKLTSLGWIPKEWEIYPVGKAFNICNNLRFPINEDVRNNMRGSYPYYGPTRIQGFINEYRVEGKYALIGEDGDHFLKWKEIPMTLLVDGKFNVNNHAHIIEGNGISITEWFFYYFNHRELTTYLTRQGAGRYKLTKATLAKMPIPLPSLDEQQKIATILSTWDEAIAKTQQLIAQMQQRNKGLMQQLLTGKKRLKRYEGEWKKQELENVLEYEQPTNYLTNNFVDKKSSGTVPVLTANKAIVLGYTKDTEGIYENPPVIIFDDFTTASKYIDFDFKVKSSAIKFLSVKDGFDLRFVFERLQLIQTNIAEHKRRWISEFTTKTIAFPPIKEQKAIAEVITKAVDEVKLLEERLAALKQQKKGMMQKLLTGEVRVKTD